MINEKGSQVRGILVVLVIISSLLLLVGITMAAYNYAQAGSNPSVLTTGQLILVLDEDLSSGINLQNAIPTKDEDGKTFNPYTFTLENTGTMSSYYTLSLTPDTEAITSNGAEGNLLDYSSVKVQFNDETPVLLSELTDLQLETGEITEGEKFEYSLRMWIDYNAGNEVMGKELYMKVKVEATQGVRTEPLPTPEECFTFADGTISAYDTSCSKDVVIPETINGETVTKLGTYSMRNKGLNSVALPNTLTTIDSYALYENNLTAIVIPEGVVTVGNSALSYNQLTAIEFPSTLTNIGYASFGHNNITALSIPNTISIIEANAFSYNQISSLDLGNGNVQFGSNVFAGNQLGKLIVPSTIKETGYYTFNNAGITELIIEDGVEIIGESSFVGNDITNLIIPNSVTTIKYGAFAYDNRIGTTGGLKKVTIGSGVQNIESRVFNNNEQLTSIVVLGKNSSSEFSSLAIGWNIVSGDSSATNVYATVTYQP